ncbi:hypothetical protein R6V09_23415 [Streptomyces sp. W16]|uniref:hypothetical protein n=1 Tax=Streptomyces sp. W16 TaxID=3076631 RepID=UPI00295B7433|nr:hypothetical protein [Streptomyces sp. W16]MDV9173052.1 hypothetical protein [Streptomyces sp. W16]
MAQSRKPTVKVAVPALVAAAVGVVALSAAWSGAHRPVQPSPVTGRQVAQAQPANPADPAGWKLPIEAYLPTKAQARLVAGSRDDLLDKCMADAGSPTWTPSPDLPEIGGKTLTDWRYGIHDAALAAKRGYHPDAAEQTAYDSAMEAGAVDTSGADAAVLDGCVTQVDGQVPATTAKAALVQQISGDAFVQSEQASEVVAVFAQWSSCMKDKGYTYAKPMDASDDARFNDPGTVTDTEIATATADIECRDKYHVEKTWFDAESALQRTAIAQHQAELDQVKADTARIVARAEAAAR